MSDREFGEANLEETNDREYCNTIGLKVPEKGMQETTFVCRILPPFGSCRDKNQKMVYHKVHWGYVGINRYNPEKMSFKRFECLERIDFETKQVLSSCPECEMIADRKQSLEQLKAECKMKGKTEEETYAVCESVHSWLKDHRLDRKWYMNVLSSDNHFYTLKISNTLKKDFLIPLLDEVAEKRKINPYAFDQGVWLEFHRRGRNLDTVDTVNLVMETVTHNGDTFEKPKKAPMSPEQVERAKKCLNDLKHDLVPVLTYDQIKKLTLCSGDPEEVDAIFNMGTTPKVTETTKSVNTTAFSKPSKDSAKEKSSIQNLVNNPVPDSDPSEDFYNQIK